MGVTISVAHGFIENQAAPLEGQLTSDTCLLHLSFSPLSSLWLHCSSFFSQHFCSLPQPQTIHQSQHWSLFLKCSNNHGFLIPPSLCPVLNFSMEAGELAYKLKHALLLQRTLDHFAVPTSASLWLLATLVPGALTPSSEYQTNAYIYT